MKKRHLYYYSFMVVVFIFLTAVPGYSLSDTLVSAKNDSTLGQSFSSPIPQWVLENWEIRTASSGIWIAENERYKSTDEPYDAYAIHWQYGVGNKHLKGRLYCIKEGEEVGSIWQFIEYWNPKENKLKIIQIGSDGTLGQGEILRTEDGKMKEFQSFVTPSGSGYSSGHLAWMENGLNHTQSFIVKGGKWTKARLYKWELKKEEKVKIPLEYEQMAYLIGTWELPLGKNKARMTFSWGKNNRTITYKNEFKPEGPTEWIQENEGLITYNGMKDALVFVTSYSDLGSPLMATGEFRFGQDGTIYREFACHYKEGAGLPWSNGDKAPKGGISIDFKQIWSPVDENKFTGEFFWKKNGHWEHPIKSGPKTETWSKI